MPTPESIVRLLQPTLMTQPARRPYSVRASYLVAFFGGALAAALFGALTARRMGTLARDAWLFIVVAVAWLTAAYWYVDALSSNALPAWLSAFDQSRRMLRYFSQALGLVSVAVLYLMRRDVWRASMLVGDPPSPWKPALACIGVSVALGWAVTIAAR